MSIPKTIHYCFGLSPDDKPWGLMHYVCLRSAIHHIKPDAVHFYYQYEPQTEWWKLTEPLITKVQVEAPRQIFGRPLFHSAHRADVIRLMALLNHGGIYLDVDVLVHRSFDDLLEHDVVLGQEGVGGQMGLCNAVILSRPNSLFLTRWLDQYRWFRGTFHGEPYWNEHSVQLPHFMSKLFANEITVLDHRAFYDLMWTEPDIYRMFQSPDRLDVSENYATHLWQSACWPLVENLTPAQIRASDTNFAHWVKPYLTDLPDNFGAIAIDGADAARRDRRQSFQQTYAHRLWGSDSRSRFFSGVGSRGPVAITYVEAMREQLAALRARLQRPIKIVDIGCGDFVVGGNLIEKADNHYIGCDIVPELIEYNRTLYARDTVSFHHLDAVLDPLPDGDVYLVRQVFQHLSNDDIAAVLNKLNGKPNVFVTESHPLEAAGPTNPDKPSNHDVRLNWRNGRGRGVELDQPPFHLSLSPICEAPNGFELVKTWSIKW